MRNLRYFTQAKVESLRTSVGNRLDWYYGSDQQSSLRLSSTDVRNAPIVAAEIHDVLELHGDHPERNDATNALRTYNTLSTLPKSRAIDERFWTYICHVECHQYVRDRWLRKRNPSNELAINDVINHFFAEDSRGIFRNNGISRLWWLGRVANEVVPDHPEQFLEIVLHFQDIRSALLERPSISANPRILKGIYEVLRFHWIDRQMDRNRRRSNRAENDLFCREPFRQWMKALNHRGTVILLDALSDDDLRQVLNYEADKALISARSWQP